MIPPTAAEKLCLVDGSDIKKQADWPVFYSFKDK